MTSGAWRAPSERPAWPALAFSLAGMFLGCFWLVLVYLQTLAAGRPWWRVAAACTPGVAILLLAALGRREPLPNGSALMLLGCLPWVLPNFPLEGALRAVFSLPVAAVGAAFVLWSLGSRKAKS